MIFGQVVIGPPGSGKTTYCKAMQEFMKGLGRNVEIINMDPGNDSLPYKCIVDVSDLITVNDAMSYMKLGPNGGLVYCMEYLEKNIDWLIDQIKHLPDKHFVLFDCPGQIEFYTHHQSINNIFQTLTKSKRISLCAVYLVDSHYCTDPCQFISVLIASLGAMLRIELPHINVLSKVDIIEKQASLLFNLDFFTEVLDLKKLLDYVPSDPFIAKYKKLNNCLAGMIEDYSLVSFLALHVEDRYSMLRVMKAADKACGYLFGSEDERTIDKLFSHAMAAEFDYEKIASLQEKYVCNSTKPISEDDL
ncbi:hypothetical protein HELRODRAFT_67088 [Helobdella robusta]|uniref:GPN-loop GTPase 2 n=1 Tax=Helobdella robusta TaxID=6412 RepID=T1FYW0_HELRO|nr:hypothetical protein HELRODRAFT_67088 [Helobdella robusta]ESN98929.1 hypothetical protein HELRODRAFT_67088 [Helobdella robusta]